MPSKGFSMELHPSLGSTSNHPEKRHVFMLIAIFTTTVTISRLHVIKLGVTTCTLKSQVWPSISRSQLKDNKIKEKFEISLILEFSFITGLSWGSLFCRTFFSQRKWMFLSRLNQFKQGMGGCLSS